MQLAFEVVEPVLADAAGMARVHVAGWRDAYGALLPPRFFDEAALEQRRRSWEAVLHGGPGDGVRVAKGPDGSILGIAAAGPSRDEGDHVPDRELLLLYVLATHHRLGIGSALLRAVLDQRPAHLWVARDNPRAQAFYRTHGFEPDGAVKTDPDAADLVEIRMLRR